MRKLTFTFIFVLFLLLPIQGGASSTTVTFTNKQIEQPDLYVTKSVTSAVSGYDIPDVEFTFTLKWDLDGDGKLTAAKNEEYTLYSEDGQEIGIYKTDLSGKFTLKAGQTVKFEYVGTNVQYKITESAAENFTQTMPAGGAAAEGTVDEYGTTVSFINTYVPSTTNVDEDETTIISIQKDLSWPAGYEIPDISQEFTFKITVSNEVLSGTAYSIYDTESGEQVSTGTTDANGTFKILGGQTAQFENIAVNVDYTVEEILDNQSIWQPVNSSSIEGGTTAPLTYVYFANSTDMFLVSKIMSDGESSADIFTFYVKDQSGNSIAGLTWYLYDSNGNLVDENVHVTDTDGSFTLYAGQYAMFIGIETGSLPYTITEDTSDFYTVSPEDGYSITSASSSPAVYTFTNSTVPLTKISIDKQDESGNALLGAVFGIYTDPSCNTSSLVQELTTGKNGLADSDGLIAGTYYLKEIKAPAGYELDEHSIYRITITKNSSIADITVEYGYFEDTAFVADPSGDTLSFWDVTSVGTGTDSENVILFTIENREVYKLPLAGSIGIFWTTIIGMFLMMSIISLYERNSRKG